MKDEQHHAMPCHAISMLLKVYPWKPVDLQWMKIENETTQHAKSMSKSVYDSWVVFGAHIQYTYTHTCIYSVVSTMCNDNGLPDHWERERHVQWSANKTTTNNYTLREKRIKQGKNRSQRSAAQRNRNLIAIHLSSKSASTDTCTLNTYSRFDCRIIRFVSHRAVYSRYLCAAPLKPWHLRCALPFLFPFHFYHIDMIENHQNQFIACRLKYLVGWPWGTTHFYHISRLIQFVLDWVIDDVCVCVCVFVLSYQAFAFKRTEYC